MWNLFLDASKPHRFTKKGKQTKKNINQLHINPFKILLATEICSGGFPDNNDLWKR